MSEPSGEFPSRPLPDRLGIEDREEISALRTSIKQRIDEAGGTDDDVVSLSTLDGRSMRLSSKTYQFEAPGGMKRGWFLGRRTPRSHPVTEQVYYLQLPPDATTPPRKLSVYSGSVDGDKEIMTHHSDPAKGIEIDFPSPRRLDGTELRSAVDEAKAILADPMTVTLGDDALYASEQLDPSDTIRGQEARDFHDMVAPVLAESMDPDPRNVRNVTRSEKRYVVHRDQVPPRLAVHSVYMLQSPMLPDSVQTSIIFDGNPFGDGKHLSAHINATYGEGIEPRDVEVKYLQDLPGDESQFPATTPIALAPDERIQVAEAIQRQLLPANLTKTRPTE